MRGALVLSLILLARAGPAPPPTTPPQSLPGLFVPWPELSRCPPLTQHPIPSSADDLRPDDFTVVMAMGDSISAGLLARGERPTWHVQREAGDQTPLWADGFNPVPRVEEFRGVSYAIGGDEYALTLPRIMDHYRNVSGASTGHHFPTTCIGMLGVMCMPHAKEDRLNAAISGSVAVGLLAQARDYLIPTYEAMEKEDGWTFLNVGVGANDICAFCLSSNIPSGPGSAREFAHGIRDGVQLVRNHIPKLIVNIMGVLRVSAVYDLTVNNPYCSGPYLPPVHLPVECSCALMPGPAGDYTRSRMDALAEEYDQAVVDIIREWNREDDPTFAAIWQPSSAIDLAHYPIEAVSPIDCFHPSEAAHRRLAAGVWNRLTMPLEYKARPFPWEDQVWVRCLEEDDRIPVNELR